MANDMLKRIIEEECPACGGCPSDCPLYDLRKLPEEVRETYINTLRSHEAFREYDKHTNCLKKRLTLEE